MTDPLYVGAMGIAILVFFFIIKMPIAFSMAFTGFLGICYVTSVQTGLSMLPRDIFEQLNSYSLSAITMFVLMGYYSFSAGLGKRLYDAAYKIVGHIRGGLAIATIFACAAFGAICGSATATAATMGKFSIPEMKKYGYNEVLATSSVASAGGLGILIPPSVIFLIYGFMTEQSIGKLFISGIVPGILLAFLMSLAVYLICLKYPHFGPKAPKTSFKEKIKSLINIIDVFALFVFVIGGLITGFFTPSQAGAMGSAGALLIGLVRREITWKVFIINTRDALRTSCMILTIITCATIFGHFMTLATIPAAVSNWIASLALSPFIIMGIIILIYLIGGCFLDAIPLIILTIPIIYPIVISKGFDPIWFGVIVVLVTCMGIITPPVGINVYVVKGLAPDVPLERIFKGITPFLIAMIVATVILIIFPSIALVLPNMVKY